MKKLLTIAIPTYNRASNLSQLLNVLAREVVGLESDVEIVVSDNASTDDTKFVLDSFYPRISILSAKKNLINIGGDRNIAFCFSISTGKYVWILGDDDLPRRGCVSQLVGILKSSDPDLLFMTALGSPDLSELMDLPPVASPEVRFMPRDRFAELVNVNLTFISSMVIKKEGLQTSSEPSPGHQFFDSNLVQLAWVLDALRTGTRFGHMVDGLVLSTTGNSGGYSVLTVFCVNHPRVVRDCLFDLPSTAHKIISRTSIGFLPRLIWDVRNSQIGAFRLPAPREVLDPALSRSRVFLLLLLPIWTGPLWLARAILVGSKVIGRVVALVDRIKAPADIGRMVSSRDGAALP